MLSIKGKLYKAMLEKIVELNYEKDKFGVLCNSCDAYTSNNNEIAHKSKCLIPKIERILVI